MISRLLSTPLKDSKKSILLLGPRQVGKSTLISSLNPDLTINFAREQEFLEFARSPERLERIVNEKIASPNRPLLDQGKSERPLSIFVDEVQRLPSLLNTVQAILDEHPRRVKFYLTGSSARKLKRGRANLLPGRINTYEMGPLCIDELGDSLATPNSFDAALSTGTLPGIWFEESFSERKKTLRSYAATYLKEEIQAESLTRNLEGFARFITLLAQWNGRTLDLSKLAQAAQVARTSVARWFEIVEETAIIRRVPAYSTKLSHRLVRHPKFYFFDGGVLNGLLSNFTCSQDRLGTLFENLILSHLSAQAMAYDAPIEIETFRTEAGVEVDFIVRLNHKLYAIEVKASRQVSAHDIKGLHRFKEIAKEPCELLLFYTGEQSEKIGEVQIKNWRTGIAEMKWRE